MKTPCKRLQRTRAAGLAALVLCYMFSTGCGRQEKTGNLPEGTASSGNGTASAEKQQTGETASENDAASFRFDPAPDKVDDLTQSSAEESRTEEEERCVLTLQVSIANPYLTKAAAAFNRQNARYSIRIEESGLGESLITCRERIQVELIAGRGPDIFVGDVFPSVANESILEKGILMDLAPLLDAAGITDEAYFPAVRALTVDEHVYGICTTINPSGFWVLESVLGGREQPDLETLVDKLYSYPDQKAKWSRYPSDYYQILDYLLGGSEDLWGMIDWEAGQCDFSGDLFSKILQIAKRYADPNGTGQAAVTGSYAVGQDIKEEVESEGKVILNYPFDDGWYPHCSVYSTLMINANTKYSEGAWAFIKYLLGEKGQNYASEYLSVSSLPVNRAMADSYMEQQRKTYEDGYLQIKVLRGDTMVEYIPTEELAEELKDYAERARYEPLKTQEIFLIIYEETELYFHGDKSLEAVCEVIRNRVQLYLDENG